MQGLGHCRRRVRPVHTNEPTHLKKHCVHFVPVPLDPKCALRDGFFEVPQVHHPHIDTVFVLNARWSFLRCVLNTTTGPDIDVASTCSSVWTASSLLAVPPCTVFRLWTVCEVAAGVPGAIRSAAGVQGAGRLPSVAGRHPVRRASATVFLVCSSVTQASES